MTAFTVRQESFEGPLDLLLTLIERRQLHIGDVALARVSEDFLAYVNSFSDFPLAESAQFVFVAATLLLIKSKSLLPSLSLTSEETQSVEELERRLTLYKRFRALSHHIREKFGKGALFLPRDRVISPTFAPPRGLSQKSLLSGIRAVLAALPVPETLSKVSVKKVISLEDMIMRLSERITRALRMNFHDFTEAHRGERVHVILGFLALLELVKQGSVDVTQEKTFGTITIETEDVEVPRY